MVYIGDKTRETPAMLLAGGRPVDAGVVGSIIKPALGRYIKPKVAYIGAANGDRESFYDMIGPLLLEAGAAEMHFVRLARENIDNNTTRAVLSDADVVFLSGGEVEDGINWIKKHGLAGLLKELYLAGKQFIGISAGAIMLGDWWVRWDVPDDDDTAALFRCLGIVPAVFDTHAEDEDWIELKTVLRLLGDGSHGYGLRRGGIISADSRGTLVDLENKYMTFVYKNGLFEIQ